MFYFATCYFGAHSWIRDIKFTPPRAAWWLAVVTSGFTWKLVVHAYVNSSIFQIHSSSIFRLISVSNFSKNDLQVKIEDIDFLRGRKDHVTGKANAKNQFRFEKFSNFCLRKSKYEELNYGWSHVLNIQFLFAKNIVKEKWTSEIIDTWSYDRDNINNFLFIIFTAFYFC